MTAPGAAERLLVVRLSGIGDVAVASTLIERIRAERPAAQVTFLTGRAAEPLVRLFDVDDVIAIDEDSLFRGGVIPRSSTLLRLWSKLLARRFDQILMLHVDTRYKALIAPLLHSRVHMLTRASHGAMNPVPGRWLGDEYARLLDGTMHVGPIERRYVMSNVRDRVAATRDDSNAVGIVPAGGRNVLRDNSLRRWPVEHYARLARDLIEAGRDVVLIGAADDRWVEPLFEGLPVRSEIGRLGLVDTLALMRGLRLVVSHDTGPMHLARLVRTPLVAIFGPTNPEQILWADDSVSVIWGGADLACRPCYDGREFARCAANVCMASTSPHVVFAAAMALMNQPSETGWTTS